MNPTEMGAMVGFLTGVYTMLDRFMKGRPIAYLVASGPVTNSILHLRVKNIGQEDVVLRRFSSVPRHYRIAKNHSSKAIVEAELSDTFGAVLQPGEQMDFPAFPSQAGRVAVRNSRRPFAIVISWRKATCTWLPQIPVRLFTSMHTIEQLKSAYRTPPNLDQ
jgi:hypothetical protein